MINLMEIYTTLMLQVPKPGASQLMHAEAALRWLIRANQQVGGQGFAAEYSLWSGWGDAYPETTGYIIPTLLNFVIRQDVAIPELEKICRMAGDWLTIIQRPDGSIRGYHTDNPLIFDTGQVIFGWLALYRYANDQKYLLAAQEAGDWLVEHQDADGAWRKFSYQDIPHTYHALVAGALLELFAVTKDAKYRSAAIDQLDWVVLQQQANGWFSWCGFFADDRANLHTIAYTLQGLVRSGELLRENKYIQYAQIVADRLLELFQQNKLWGEYDSQWQAVGHYQCLTGLAQLGLVWHDLFRLTSNNVYDVAARKLWGRLTKYQVIAPSLTNLNGALSGSFPVWGKYMPFSYPNWAPKFYLDLYLALHQ